MVRATAAEVLKLFNGAYPTGISATTVGDLLAQADYEMDAYTRPSTISATDTSGIHIANKIVVNLSIWGLWLHDGGQLSGKEEPEILTQRIKDELDRLKVDTAHDGAVYGEMIDDS